MGSNPVPATGNTKRSQVRRRIAILISTLAVLLAGFGIVAQPAYAGIPCGTLQVCTYEHNGYAGQMYYYTGPFNSCILIGSPWTNMISSVINNKDIPVRLYHNSTCSYNLWNQDVQPHHQLFHCPEQLNDHVWSIWIGFTPP